VLQVKGWKWDGKGHVRSSTLSIRWSRGGTDRGGKGKKQDYVKTGDGFRYGPETPPLEERQAILEKKNPCSEPPRWEKEVQNWAKKRKNLHCTLKKKVARKLVPEKKGGKPQVLTSTEVFQGPTKKDLRSKKTRGAV